MRAYDLIRPLLFQLDAEDAHKLAIRALKSPFRPARPRDGHACLRIQLWGMDFPNPVGLAAGFDKNAEVVDALLDLGFGFVEAGSVTPRPQPGNPRPRLFRLREADAVLNRMGFNNEGLEAFAQRLQGRLPVSGPRRGIVGANLGKNKDTEDAADDYVLGVRRLAALADYLVVNVSSPNTPGLRALQGRGPLRELLVRVLAARDERVEIQRLERSPPLLLKIAPDLTDEDKADIAAVALEVGIDGLIVSNTTIERPDSIDPRWRGEAGGLSGRPLLGPSTRVLGEMWRLTGGALPLIGVGGIARAEDAYAKIRAGASLVQFYSAMVYQGPAMVGDITRGLAALLARDGFSTLADAVGADHRT